jgi:hypothetical protein
VPLFQYTVFEDRVPYTGRELRSGWVAGATGFAGDAAAGFRGPCRVETEDLVDLEDARQGAFIEAAEMAHIIVEHFDCELGVAVLRQRLLVCILCEILAEKGIGVRRSGDDVFVGRDKLTVSIAAPSKRSCLIHLGINIDPRGAPVPAVGLRGLDVDGGELLKTLLERYRAELLSVEHAGTKVRTVD